MIQAGEPGNEAAQADHAEDPQNAAAVGDDQPQPAAFGQGPLVRCHQRAEPLRITEPGAGHVHHDRRMPATARFQQDDPQLLSVADVDLFGRFYHGHAVDQQGISVIRHLCPPPAGTRILPGYQVGHAEVRAGRPATPDRLA